ncbi:hypothetical protein ANN_25668 [Periplaneta americana]|uniref:Uncharacterized protein n=1 Tax=Periplaneta americana TaxID=6978 RepID=A0ABQ8S4B5_PERAM|nr:hypothetical protein ANN_25668 [Periplaneta americana]
MTGLCEGGNEPPGSLKASKSEEDRNAAVSASTSVCVYVVYSVVIKSAVISSSRNLDAFSDNETRHRQSKEKINENKINRQRERGFRVIENNAKRKPSHE